MSRTEAATPKPKSIAWVLSLDFDGTLWLIPSLLTSQYRGHDVQAQRDYDERARIGAFRPPENVERFLPAQADEWVNNFLSLNNKELPDVVRIYCGSNRQDANTDFDGTKKFYRGGPEHIEHIHSVVLSSAFSVYKKDVVEAIKGAIERARAQLRAEKKDISVTFDHYLQTDALHGKSDGETIAATEGLYADDFGAASDALTALAAQGTDDSNRETKIAEREEQRKKVEGAIQTVKEAKATRHWAFVSLMDRPKIILLYNQMHRAALTYPNQNIIFDFCDDLRDLVENAQRFYSTYPDLIPNNVRLRIYQNKLQQKNDAAKKDSAIENLVGSLIQGTAKEADKNADKTATGLLKAFAGVDPQNKEFCGSFQIDYRNYLTHDSLKRKFEEMRTTVAAANASSATAVPRDAFFPGANNNPAAAATATPPNNLPLNPHGNA